MQVLNPAVTIHTITGKT